MRYPVVIHKDEGSSYVVTVPDLPGCFSGGDTLDGAFDMAREAIAGHIETLLIDGEPIPENAPLEMHQANQDYTDGIWGLVDVDVSKLSDKTVRVNVTMPAHVLAIIDEAAIREGESRSGLLTRAVLDHMSRQSSK